MTRSCLRPFNTTIFDTKVDPSKIVSFEVFNKRDSNQNEPSLLYDLRRSYKKRKFLFLFGDYFCRGKSEFLENCGTKHRFIVSNKLTDKEQCQKKREKVYSIVR